MILRDPGMKNSQDDPWKVRGIFFSGLSYSTRFFVVSCRGSPIKRKQAAVDENTPCMESMTKLLNA